MNFLLCLSNLVVTFRGFESVAENVLQFSSLYVRLGCFAAQSLTCNVLILAVKPVSQDARGTVRSGEASGSSTGTSPVPSSVPFVTIHRNQRRSQRNSLAEHLLVLVHGINAGLAFLSVRLISPLNCPCLIYNSIL